MSLCVLKAKNNVKYLQFVTIVSRKDLKNFNSYRLLAIYPIVLWPSRRWQPPHRSVRSGVRLRQILAFPEFSTDFYRFNRKLSSPSKPSATTWRLTTTLSSFDKLSMDSLMLLKKWAKQKNHVFRSTTIKHIWKYQSNNAMLHFQINLFLTLLECQTKPYLFIKYLNVKKIDPT